MYDYGLNKLTSLNEKASSLLRRKNKIKNKNEQLNKEINRLNLYLVETKHRIAFIKEYESKRALVRLLDLTIILSAIAILTALAFVGAFALFALGMPAIFAAIFSIICVNADFADKLEYDIRKHREVNTTFDRDELKSFCDNVNKDLSAMLEPFNEHTIMFNEQRNSSPTFLPMSENKYNDSIYGIEEGIVVDNYEVFGIKENMVGNENLYTLKRR